MINNYRSRLCPVYDLSLYLKLSFPKGNGPLFTNRRGKPISIFTLSKLVVKLILKGDSQNKVKVHDIRKYASSLSFMDSMDIKDLLHSMHWKSSAAFYRHYMFATTTPNQAVAIPGRCIRRDDDDNIPDDNSHDEVLPDDNLLQITTSEEKEASDYQSSEFSCEY